MSIPFFDAVLSGKATSQAVVDRETSWFPNESFAACWREFSEHGTLKPIHPNLTAPKLTVTQDSKGHARLSWCVIPELTGGLRALRFYRDGMLWKELGLKPTDFLATSRDSTPEILRQHELSDDSAGAHSYKLTYLDTAGNESK